MRSIRTRWLTSDYGLGTTTDGSGWTWRSATYDSNNGTNWKWKNNASEHEFTVGDCTRRPVHLGSCTYHAMIEWTNSPYNLTDGGELLHREAIDDRQPDRRGRRLIQSPPLT